MSIETFKGDRLRALTFAVEKGPLDLLKKIINAGVDVNTIVQARE